MSDLPGHTNRSRTEMFLLALMPAFILLACGEEPQPEEPVARPVRILTVGAVGGGATLEYPGVIQASQTTDLGFEVAGRLVELRVNEGDAVERGQILARLDPRDFESARDAESANRKLAEAEYERYRQLYAEDAVALSELEIKRRNFEVTEASVRKAEKALEDTSLRAPFAGTVSRRHVDNFVNVQAKQPVVTLTDESGLEVIVAIPEADWARARPGISAREAASRVQPMVEVSAYPGREFPAVTKEIATSADPTTRTYAVTLAFDPPDDQVVRPGMTARVVVRNPDADSNAAAIWIPSGIVVSGEGGSSYVWLLDETSMAVRRAPVVLGEMAGDRVRVKEGLSPGDQVAASGVHQLRDGMAVLRLSN